jgi:hypothetical protein
MTQEFVPYQLALELKQLGFDEPCFGRFDGRGKNKGKIWYEMPNTGQDSIPVGDVLAPTYSQAFRWFREQQEWPIESWIRPFISQQPRSYSAMIWTRGQIIQAGVFSTHDEAQLNLLRKLIEIVKTKQ